MATLKISDLSVGDWGFDNPCEAMISRIANKTKWVELNKEYLEEK